MSQFNDLSDRQHHKEQFYAGGPPADPIATAAKFGGVHYNRSLGTVLTPTSHMPHGPHLGKIMAEVPTDYLAWVNAQAWAKHWPRWQPIADYLSRHPLHPVTRAINPGPHCLRLIGQRLACVPGYEDRLQTFAHGALDLGPSHYQPTQRLKPPHYVLTAQQVEKCHSHRVPNIAGHAKDTFLKDWERHLGQCTRHCYGSEADAQRSADFDNPQRRQQNKPLLSPTFCETCQLWHLTTKTQIPAP